MPSRSTSFMLNASRTGFRAARTRSRCAMSARTLALAPRLGVSQPVLELIDVQPEVIRRADARSFVDEPVSTVVERPKISAFSTSRLEAPGVPPSGAAFLRTFRLWASTRVLLSARGRRRSPTLCAKRCREQDRETKGTRNVCGEPPLPLPGQLPQTQNGSGFSPAVNTPPTDLPDLDLPSADELDRMLAEARKGIRDLLPRCALVWRAVPEDALGREVLH